MEKCFDKLMDILGIELSKKIHSYVKCCRKATIYGIEWNLETKRCNIPLKKLNKFKNYLLIAMKYRIVTGRFLDYISGIIYILKYK